jgi:hypothetical protein
MSGEGKNSTDAAFQRACVSLPTSECLFKIATNAADEMEFQLSKNMRDGMLAEIVKGEAQTGHIALARATAETIEDHNSRAQASGAIAIELAKSGEIDAALGIVSTIYNNDVSGRDGLYSRIATIQGRAGDLEGARLTARSIQSDIWRQETSRQLARISQPQASDGRLFVREVPRRGQAAAEVLVNTTPNLAEALATAINLTDPFEKAEALSSIAIAYAREGDRETALRIAHEIGRTSSCLKTCDGRREMTINAIALVQLERGDRAGALDIANRLDANSRSIALADIAEAELHQGSIRESAETGTLIGRADLRAKIFNEIAIAASAHL